MTASLIRRFTFSSSHLYRRPEWSEEENRRQFGACANLPGHGHNYRLWVEIEGEPDEESGFIVGLETLDRIVQDRVLSRVDHQHLNQALPEFAPGKAIPSCENLVLWVKSQLEGFLPSGVRLVSLRLCESESLGAAWRLS